MASLRASTIGINTTTMTSSSMSLKGSFLLTSRAGRLVLHPGKVLFSRRVSCTGHGPRNEPSCLWWKRVPSYQPGVYRKCGRDSAVRPFGRRGRKDSQSTLISLGLWLRAPSYGQVDIETTRTPLRSRPRSSIWRQMLGLVQPEMESGCSPLVSDPPFGRGFPRHR